MPELENAGPHVDEGTLHAWLDGALSGADHARVEMHVAICAECAARAAEARGLVAASSRILGALDNAQRGVVPGARAASIEGVRSMAAALEQKRRRRWMTSAPLAAVAAAALVAIVVRQSSPGASAPAIAPSTAASSEIVADSPRSSVAVGKLESATPIPRAASVPRAATRKTNSATSNDRKASEPAIAPTAPAPVAPAAVARSANAGAALERAAAAPTAEASRTPRAMAFRLRGADSVSPQPATTALQGQVLSARTGQPLAGASVVVRGTQRRSTTDSAGRFSIAGIPAGQQVVTATVIGYAAANASVAVPDKDTARVELALQPSELRLSEVIVNGRTASPPPSIPNAKIVSVDQARSGSRTIVYALGSGARVTLIEDHATVQQSHATPGGSTRADAKSSSVNAVGNSITWVGRDGAHYTLSGPLDIAELQSLRATIQR